MTKFPYRLPKWAAAVTAASLAGCSLHPIPDNVSRHATEDIVRNVRCEAKAAVRERILLGLEKYGLSGINPDTVLENRADFAKISRRSRLLAKKFQAYGASTIAYDFDFTIDETNDKSGAASFMIPFVNGGSFTLGLDGALHKARSGHRTFKTVERFRDLARLPCGDWVQPGRNIVYPLTGSIGVGRIMKTFIEVSELGGGSADFTDVITFTTKLNGSVKPELVLEPVPDRFRLVKANGNFGADRQDIHKVTVAIAFPQIDLRPVQENEPIRDSIANLSDDTRVRALENLCIASAREREDRFGTLRLTSPEEFCRKGAAATL